MGPCLGWPHRGLVRLATKWRLQLGKPALQLANRSARGADAVTATALEAAQVQQTALPGKDIAAWKRITAGTN
ncbi:hypothetical protein ABZ922_26820 [Streptomyces shenzhenensis]|uniref:hypothetical protein n=1 Tax=Streptomyces shenzhenensis TaxID=943815 RepID=UPI0033CD5E82